MTSPSPPPVFDVDLVGSFEAEVFAGGGYVWDEVLEYPILPKNAYEWLSSPTDPASSSTGYMTGSGGMSG